MGEMPIEAGVAGMKNIPSPIRELKKGNSEVLLAAINLKISTISLSSSISSV